MEIGIKTLAIGIVVVTGLSAAFTKFYFPSIKEKTEVVEKEVTKTDIITVTKEVVRPDGTKETVTTTTDKSVTKSDTRQTEMKMDIKSKYIFGVAAYSNFKDKPDYEVSAGMRVLGPIFGQVKYQTNGSVGVGVLVEF